MPAPIRDDLRNPARPLDTMFRVERVYNDPRGFEYQNPTLRISGEYEGNAADFNVLINRIRMMFLERDDVKQLDLCSKGDNDGGTRPEAER